MTTTFCTAAPHDAAPRALFELRFANLFGAGRNLAFPCDAAGHVDMDSMSGRARNSYLAARALIGREFAFPKVRRFDTGPPG